MAYSSAKALALKDDICRGISEGRSLRSICAEKDKPDKATVFRWLDEDEVFRDQYARARDLQADALFDEILDIADDSQNDWVERKHFAGADESQQLNGEAVARARLRIDARKWMAGKLKPKKYGEKLDIDQTVGVTGELGALLQRVADTGRRLVNSED